MALIVGLKEIVSEASQALASLDAQRLEEMAVSCQILNRCSEASGVADEFVSGLAGPERFQAARELALLGRILEATRLNLKVLYRLREIRAARLEYAPERGGDWIGQTVVSKEAAHGDD